MMNYLRLALAALWLSLAWSPCGFAQTMEEEGISRGEEGRGREGSGVLDDLSPEMRERFRLAREKALQDPRLQELRRNAQRANRDFFKAMRAKMLEIDPGLANIVKKWVLERKAWKAWGREDGNRGFSDLTDAERDKLITGLQKANSDPAVEAAQKRKRQASTREERRLAQDDYLRALNEAMVRIDPSVAPILEKLSARREPSSSAAE